MNKGKQDMFMKELISRETKETVEELGKIINDSNYKSDHESENLKPLIVLFLHQSVNVDDSNKDKSNKDVISGNDIINIIKHILKHKLDFNNRLNGGQNILEQWQKTRASKNEELSIKLRESGNDYLRIGQLNKALLLYNEALLYGFYL